MPSQTLYRLTSQTGLDSIRAIEEPVPVAGKYEVLIKIHSIGINYRDVAIATDKYPLKVIDNLVLCSDFAGEISEVGESVDGFSPGDPVTAAIDPTYLYGAFKHYTGTLGGYRDGVLREYIVLPAHAVVKLPTSSHDFSQWASLPSVGSTVWNSFYGNVPLKPGDTVLVLGTGGVSLVALIFAKAAGAITIVTSSSETKLEYVKSQFGADHTINYKTHHDWAAEVQRITNGQGADHIIEVGGAGTIQQSLESVAYGGVISVIGYLSPISSETMPDVPLEALKKACVVRGIMGGSKQQLEEAVAFVGKRELKLPVDKVFGFNRDGIIAALEYVASGKQIGKVCINLT